MQLRAGKKKQNKQNKTDFIPCIPTNLRSRRRVGRSTADELGGRDFIPIIPLIPFIPFISGVGGWRGDPE